MVVSSIQYRDENTIVLCKGRQPCPGVISSEISKMLRFFAPPGPHFIMDGYGYQHDLSTHFTETGTHK